MILNILNRDIRTGYGSYLLPNTDLDTTKTIGSGSATLVQRHKNAYKYYITIDGIHFRFSGIIYFKTSNRIARTNCP